jgi:hypothetical protein
VNVALGTHASDKVQAHDENPWRSREKRVWVIAEGSLLPYFDAALDVIMLWRFAISQRTA